MIQESNVREKEEKPVPIEEPMSSYFTLDALTQVKDYSQINKISGSSFLP